MRRSSKLAAVVTAGDHVPRDDRLRQATASSDGRQRRGQRRPRGVRRQGRHGLRRGRPRRPVVQRLGGRRPGQGRSRSSASTAQEAEAEDGEHETAREERLRTLADAGYDPIIAVGFAYAAGADARSPTEYPDVHFAIIDDYSSIARRRQRRRPGLRRGAGLLPRRCGGRAEDEGQPRRLHRWRRDAADQEVRGRLHRRRQGRRPGHQGRRQVPHPGPGLLRLR